MLLRCVTVLALTLKINQISSEVCELAQHCRLVDINGDNEWLNIPGHYRSIQKCINEANYGDTCLVRTGHYFEELIISNKNNLAIRGDLDYGRPVIDGTIELKPKNKYDNSSRRIDDVGWNEEFINGKKVCIGELEITDGKHPFQLFLRENSVLEMMTNARWPNAIWAEKEPKTGTPLVFYNEFWGKSDEMSTIFGPPWPP